MVDHLWIKDESKVLTTYPPRYAWECARCGAVETTEGGMPSTDGCKAHASIELLRTMIGESGITLAERVQLGNLVDDVELRLKLAEGRRKTERNNFEQVCKQRDRLKEQLKVLQAEVNELREKVGRMAEADARWDAMRRDLENIIAERDECYMKLPVDADGVPIRLGDVVAEEEFCPEGGTVVGMKTYSSIGRWLVNCGAWVDSRKCRHAKPDTLEGLLQKLADEVWEASTTCQTTWSDSGLDGIAERYAERIRKAVDDGS